MCIDGVEEKGYEPASRVDDRKPARLAWQACRICRREVEDGLQKHAQDEQEVRDQKRHR